MNKFDAQTHVEETINEAAADFYTTGGEFGDDKIILADGVVKCDGCDWEIPKKQVIKSNDRDLCGFCFQGEN